MAIDKAGGKLVVDHQAIPGLMGAMTMAYGVNDPRALDRISRGDEITAKVVVSGGSYLLDNVTVVAKTAK